MKSRAILAVGVCKAAHAAIRLLRRGGTAMPGKIALKICPDLAAELAAEMDIIAITGTNGKTTSARMVEEALHEGGINCVANRSGANLLSGIVTELAQNADCVGRPRVKTAVIECDEAAARRAFGQLKPRVILVTNLFRDQLDRYGEVTHTLENLRAGISQAPEAVLCLNADCSLTASLAEGAPNAVRWYGLGKDAAAGASAPEISDATHCLACRAAYEYDYVTYGHLGGWRCPRCGRKRPAADVSVERVSARMPDCTDCELRVDGAQYAMRVNLPADYNLYNAAGAVTAAAAAGVDVQAAVNAAGEFRCGFGRMERFDLGGAGARMMLVKNPAGCCRVLEFLQTLEGKFNLVVCLNDNDADGTDVSWIWDADFETLADLGTLGSVTVGGTRACDMAMRIKYAGVASEKITVEPSWDGLAEKIAASAEPVYIMPTYTAMLSLRAQLIKHTGGSDFWEG
ncbi:MAG: MurT ligase domain-containing protein [Oscillospiraceae bacterium]|nr:MurT ligase domain-containing protein [Oscillospiraceae bacterium]